MSEKLLIVDDETHIRDMLARHFKLVGFEVITAESGNQAIETLEELPIDIIISDLMMFDGSGLDLLKYLKKELPFVPCIILTGYVSLDNALACMRSGAETIIFKPLEDLNEIETVVRDCSRRLQRWRKKLRDLRGMAPEEG